MKYLVRPQDLKPYSPANHTGTKNLRLIGPETVGAKHSANDILAALRHVAVEAVLDRDLLQIFRGHILELAWRVMAPQLAFCI